ncbi:Histone deacetylase complex subunit sap18 [Rhodotorula kratochvilovae]
MVPPPADHRPRVPRVDRTKVSPSLLRVFVRTGAHHPDAEFTVDRLPVADELQLYTWRDSTLRELLHLLRDASPPLRAHPLAKYSLRLVFFDPETSLYKSSDLALISARDLLLPSAAPPAPPQGARSHLPPAAHGAQRLDRTLAEAKYIVGDLLDVALLLPDAPAPALGPGAPPGTLGVAGPFGIRGAAAGGGRGGFGAPGGRGGPPGMGMGMGPGARRPDTWAPAPAHARPPHVRGGGPPHMRGGPGAGGPRGGAAPPADQGWGGARRRSDAGGAGGPGGGGSDGRDRPPHVPPPARRRSSRSRSPGPRRDARSPPPPRRRRDDDDDVPMRD